MNGNDLYRELLTLLTYPEKFQTAQIEELFETNQEKAIDLVKRHSLENRLYAVLAKFAQNALPDTIKQEFRTKYQNDLARSLQNKELVNRIQSLCENEKITPLYLKGIVLANSVYDSPAERPMVDVDILVKQSEVHKLIVILREMGCRTILPNAGHLGNHIRTINQVSFRLGDSNHLFIDMHYGLFALSSPFIIDVDELLIETTIFDAEHRLHTLNSTEFLLHMCIHHAFLNHYNPMRGILDIVLFMKTHKDTLDWDRILKTASEWRCRNLLILTFGVVNAFVDSDEIPQDLRSLTGRNELSEKVYLIKSSILTRESVPSQSLMFLSELFEAGGWHRTLRMYLRPGRFRQVNSIIHEIYGEGNRKDFTLKSLFYIMNGVIVYFLTRWRNLRVIKLRRWMAKK
ncbi:nucleotidyltransferase family protein [Calditrichota bacterium]